MRREAFGGDLGVREVEGPATCPAAKLFGPRTSSSTKSGAPPASAAWTSAQSVSSASSASKCAHATVAGAAGGAATAEGAGPSVAAGVVCRVVIGSPGVRAGAVSRSGYGSSIGSADGFRRYSAMPTLPDRPPPNRRVVAVACDGLCAFEFGIAAELFGLPRPELGVDRYDFETVSIDAGPLATLGGATLVAPVDLDRVASAGTVVLPGWRDVEERPPERLLAALRTAQAGGARLLSICSGVFVLAATGLLDGRAATMHWRYTTRLRAMFPAIDVRENVLYVDAGELLSSAGSAAGLDLGLHLIRRDHGAAVAGRVAQRLVVPPHRDGGQAQLVETPVQATPSRSLAATLDRALARLHRPLAVADLARHAALAPRSFARRFSAEVGVPPGRWLIRQRVLLARRLLETGDAKVETVAERAGFGTAAALRHHFGRETGTTPRRYRASVKRSSPTSGKRR